jgi:hypothetical protein
MLPSFRWLALPLRVFAQPTVFAIPADGVAERFLYRAKTHAQFSLTLSVVEMGTIALTGHQARRRKAEERGFSGQAGPQFLKRSQREQNAVWIVGVVLISVMTTPSLGRTFKTINSAKRQQRGNTKQGKEK